MYFRKTSSLHSGLIYWTTLLFIWRSVNTAFALPPDTATCNCVRVTYCEPYTSLLLNHKSDQRADIFRLIRNASCGRSHREPLVCCPESNDVIQFKNPQRETNTLMRAPRNEEPWIWERRPYTPEEQARVRGIISTRFGEIDINSLEDGNTQGKILN